MKLVLGLMIGLEASAMLVISDPATIVLDEPRLRAHVEDVLRFGTPVTIDEELTGWFKIRYEGWQGWVPTGSVLEVDRDPNATADATISFRGAYLFDVADTEWGPVTSLPFESPVQILEELPAQNHRWLRVKLFNGKTGFVQRSHLLFSRPKLALDEMVQFSKNFLGINYVYGGTTSFGYDCSGFVQMLYRQMGITLPRNSSAQAADPRLIPVTGKSDMEEGEHVEPQGGDLVFFFNSSGKVTHVGMMLNAEEFIHSFTKGEAWICTGHLSDEKWKNGQVYYGTQVKRLKI